MQFISSSEPAVRETEEWDLASSPTLLQVPHAPQSDRRADIFGALWCLLILGLPITFVYLILSRFAAL